MVNKEALVMATLWYNLNTVDTCYNDTVGIRQKYQYIQTTNLSSKLSILGNGRDTEITL